MIRERKKTKQIIKKEKNECLEEFEKLQKLVEMTKMPLTKCVTKGTKQQGINARKALREIHRRSKKLIEMSLKQQKKVRAEKPVHGNTNGPGVKAMLKKRQILFEE